MQVTVELPEVMKLVETFGYEVTDPETITLEKLKRGILDEVWRNAQDRHPWISRHGGSEKMSLSCEGSPIQTDDALRRSLEKIKVVFRVKFHFNDRTGA